MNKGACGVEAMNLKLQLLLNPKPTTFLEINRMKYGVGDKVIQKKNNYDLHIFNGDMGYIISIDHKKYEMTCEFSGKEVQIPFDCLSDLGLAYAITIHKSQGSQSPAIVIPLSPQHYPMLQRNLFYTGITRAKKLAIVIGNRASIFNAVKNNDSNKRITRLKFLLQSMGS
jgi:exodeoxyribonuclease V alpha subunit